MEWEKGRYRITDDPAQIKIDVVWRLLQTTYWKDRRPREIVEKIVARSLCFSLFDDTRQIGFGRAVTDKATITWLADVVVEPAYRSRGLGTWFVACVVSHPAIKGTQMALQTLDAHGFYEKFGFSANCALMSTVAHNL